MSLTSKERGEREKQRREAANARMREKVAAARKRGICCCCGKLDKKPGPDGTTAPARTVGRRQWPQLLATIARVRCRRARFPLRNSTVGREAWWWFASAYINGRQRTRRWSVDKYGDRGAWQQAMEQRREWENESS